jgi:hypothetical protein
MTAPRMNRLVAASFSIVIAVELVAIAAPDRRIALWAAGAVVAVSLLSFGRLVVGAGDGAPADHDRGGPTESLQRWLSRTQTMIHWSDSTRSDWDKHLRPMLARQYEMATGQRRAKDPDSYQATGRMLFGDELWCWVDPENVRRSRRDEPGPGRTALDRILQRLEQV